MHVYFSGIGGTAIGPLAIIAHQAGYQVSGSDKQGSKYIDYLISIGVKDIHIGQTLGNISTVHSKNSIDWIVFSSAVLIEKPNHPEKIFAQENKIKYTKRDEFLNKIMTDNKLKLLAVAGTHGKTTTTAMLVWLFKQLGVPVSYSVGAKIPFGEMGQFDSKSNYFVYECDEFDKNFLAFNPFLSLISGIDYDHQEVFPTFDQYLGAFRQFLNQSNKTIIWDEDAQKLKIENDSSIELIDKSFSTIANLKLPGKVNREDAFLAITAANKILDEPIEKLMSIIEKFPGLSRRFEKISDNLYSDYAHTIPKIRGCLQTAKELSKNIVVVYEPLTDRRQHFIKNDYKNLFEDVKKLYWVPSYLAREDKSKEVLSPSKLIQHLDNPKIAEPETLDTELKSKIKQHINNGDLVVCMSGGGGGSLDEWLRKEFK